MDAVSVAARHARKLVADRRARTARDSDRRTGPTQPRATLLSHGAALLSVEDVARVRDGVVSNVDEVAITRLTKYVAPIITVRPELRVPVREVDAPDHGDAQEIGVTDQRRDENHAVHEQVRREFAPEDDDLFRFPSPPFFRGRRAN